VGLRVVAEGVEDEDTLEMLRLAGCELVQGYLTGRPAPADDVLDALLPAPRTAPAGPSVTSGVADPAAVLGVGHGLPSPPGRVS
jgi:predicted signal transduction protein with EAL and GGDEF domain